MTVKDLLLHSDFKSVVVPEPEREIGGVYIGDLLSWVMGRINSNDVWITIMSNINIVAVASLADVSCILLAEGVSLEEDVIKTAMQKQINIISTEKDIYKAAVELNKIL